MLQHVDLKKTGLKPPRDGKMLSALDLLKLKEFTVKDLVKIFPEVKKIKQEILSQIKIDSLYSGYIKRQENDIKSFKRDEKLKIPKGIDFNLVGGLSNEAIEKTDQNQTRNNFTSIKNLGNNTSSHRVSFKAYT